MFGSGIDHDRRRMERASTSIPLNIAEGNGKFTGADRLWSIVSMLVALIKANSDYRLHDQAAE